MSGTKTRRLFTLLWVCFGLLSLLAITRISAQTPDEECFDFKVETMDEKASDDQECHVGEKGRKVDLAVSALFAWLDSLLWLYISMSYFILCAHLLFCVGKRCKGKMQR